MKKVQKTVNIAVILSETSHVFCCVLPTVFSIVSVMAGLGMVSAMPLWLESVHEAMHDWEVPLIVFSGLMISLGWGLHVYSQKIDCHDTGCHHPPCAPVKKKNNRLLIIATVLFAVNALIYFGLHRAIDSGAIATKHVHEAEQGHEAEHDHDAHGHDEVEH